MPIGAIVQARMHSERLPRKSMAEICGEPVLQRVVERVQEAGLPVYIVTPDREIAEWADGRGIPISMDRISRDVLDSYYYCAETYGIDPIVRITADNPLIRPETIRRVVRLYQRERPDWASNCRVSVTFPVGDDVEVFSFKALREAWRHRDRYSAEHVTPYIYGHPERFKLAILEQNPSEAHLRWTVDTQADLDNVRSIYAATLGN